MYLHVRGHDSHQGSDATLLGLNLSSICIRTPASATTLEAAPRAKRVLSWVTVVGGGGGGVAGGGGGAGGGGCGGGDLDDGGGLGREVGGGGGGDGGGDGDGDGGGNGDGDGGGGGGICVALSGDGGGGENDTTLTAGSNSRLANDEQSTSNTTTPAANAIGGTSRLQVLLLRLPPFVAADLLLFAFLLRVRFGFFCLVRVTASCCCSSSSSDESAKRIATSSVMNPRKTVERKMDAEGL